MSSTSNKSERKSTRKCKNSRPKYKLELTLVFICFALCGCISPSKRESDYLAKTEFLANSGDLSAQIELGDFFLDRNRPDDRRNALRWFDRASNDESGYAAFQAHLLMLNGNSAERAKAFVRLEQSAEFGYAQAQFDLAETLMGITPASEATVREGFGWYLKAARQGIREAQYKLATMLFSGRGTTSDVVAASDWLNRAALQGDSRAQLALGDFYLLGLGVSEDLTSAFDWYRKSAEQGDTEAQSKLGDLFTYDRFSALRDPTSGARWYRLSAEKGYAHAQSRLGNLYENGFGVRRNITTAAQWYRSAATQGHAAAQCHLGSLYQRGAGVVQDRNEAEYWYNLAAAQVPAGVMPLIGFVYYDCSHFATEFVPLNPDLNGEFPGDK